MTSVEFAHAPQSVSRPVGGTWALAGVIAIPLIWLIPLLIRTCDVYLDHDTLHQIEGIVDRVRRPGADVHLGIYGEPYAPLFVKAASIMASRVSPARLVVLSNVLTVVAALVTLVCVFVAYGETFARGELLAAVVLASLAPISVYSNLTLHPYSWALAVFSVGLALTRCRSMVWRYVVPIGLIGVAFMIRRDALLFVPIYLQRVMHGRRWLMAAWAASMVAPVGGLIYGLATRDAFISMYWTTKRLALLPRALLQALGIGGILAAVSLGLRWRRGTRAEWWQVVASWTLPTLLFYGANPYFLRHLLLLSYGTAFMLVLENPLADLVSRAKWRAMAAALGVVCLGQLAYVGWTIDRRAAERRERLSAYATLMAAPRGEQVDLIQYYDWQDGEPLFPYWAAVHGPNDYRLSRHAATSSRDDVAGGDVTVVDVGGRRIYLVPGRLRGANAAIDDVVASCRRFAALHPERSLAGFLPVAPADGRRLDATLGAPRETDTARPRSG